MFERVAASEGKHHAQQRSHPELFTQLLSRAKPEEASVVTAHQAVFVVCVDIPRSGLGSWTSRSRAWLSMNSRMSKLLIDSPITPALASLV